MNGKRNRQHGIDWERQVCRDLQTVGVDAHRRLEWREGSDDIEHPYQHLCSFQCKATRTTNYGAMLKEMVKRKPSLPHHFLICQPYHHLPLVVMPYSQFLDVVKHLKETLWT